MVAKANISSRIEMIIDHYKENKNSFSNKIGLTNNVTIGRILNENRKPSYDVLSKIAFAYPDINYNWLLTGQGSMLNEEKEKSPVMKTIDQDHKQSLDAIMERKIEAIFEEKIKEITGPILERIEQLEYEDKSDAYDRRSLEQSMLDKIKELRNMIENIQVRRIG